MGEEASVDPSPAKRARTGDLKRVAEIVMVLSAMGEMRGGKEPTAVEKALAAEARENLAGFCEEEMKPKDLISREAVRAVVEDLGLNRSRDPMMGFRPPKMSIAEKLLLTKRKMEESKGFTPHSSVSSFQLHPVGFGTNSDSHSTLLHGTPKFSAGGFHPVSPGVHAPAVDSATSSLKQSYIGEAQFGVNSLKSSTSHLEKGSHMLAKPHADTPLAQLNGSPYLSQAQAVADERNPAIAAVQSTLAIVKPGQVNNLVNHTHVKPEGAHAIINVNTNNQVLGNQDANTSEVPGASLNLSIGHQPMQGIMFVQGPAFYTNHDDISKAVQKILQPKVFDHPNWAPPSTEYINQPLNCQICKISISDVESLLICDACDKGTHLKCLQSYGNKEGIPKAEWHCPKCLMTSHGKPLPPKYGRVTRTFGPSSKAPLKIVSSCASIENKPVILDVKINQQKLVANGSSSSPHFVHASSFATNNSMATPESKTAHADENKAGVKNNGEMNTATSTNNSIEKDRVVFVTSSVKNENFDVKEIKSCESSSCDMERATSESVLHPKVESDLPCAEGFHDFSVGRTDQSQVAFESKVLEEAGVPISEKVSTDRQQDISKCSTKELEEPSELQGESQCEAGCDVRLDAQASSQMASNLNNIGSKTSFELKGTSEVDTNRNSLLGFQDNCQVTTNGNMENGNQSGGCDSASLPKTDVHWLGDIVQVRETQTYYQSCQINGVVYKLEDHVLFSSGSEKVLPSKLKSLWEENRTGSKWASVNQYVFPNDLPEVVSKPSTSETNEVYASNWENTIAASSICGMCEILPMDKFLEVAERRTHLDDAHSGSHPLFLCRWLYDESKCAFQSLTN